MAVDDSRLARLRRDLPLGEGWSVPERIEDVIEVASARIARAGLGCRDEQGREASGSAAEIEGSPLVRAYAELVERVSILEAMGRPAADSLFPDSDEPARWQYSRSNGIALHTSYEEARRRAMWELVERDRFLRSWYGLVAPERCDVPAVFATGNLDTVYDWWAGMLPDPEPRGWDAEVRVAVVVGFPRSPRAPLVRGSAARPRAAGAVDAAAREAVQQLAFLWNEELPSELPNLLPSPQLHLDWYLYPEHHAMLRAWLGGGHQRFGAAWAARRSLASPPSFVDITPDWLEGKASVVKAICTDAIPLTFGVGPERLSGHLPAELRVHPVA